MKKSRRGHKWRTTKRYEKIQKGFKWRIYNILPICSFFGILCSEKWNNSFKELTLLIIRAKPDVGRTHEQQQKKTRLDQGKIFIIRNTRTHTRQFNTYWTRLPNIGKRTTQHRIDIMRKHQHCKLIKQWMNLEDMPFTLNFLKTTRARKEKNYQKKRARKVKSVRVV